MKSEANNQPKPSSNIEEPDEILAIFANNLDYLQGLLEKSISNKKYIIEHNKVYEQAKTQLNAHFLSIAEGIIGADEMIATHWPSHNETDNSREIYLQTLGANNLKAMLRQAFHKAFNQGEE